MKIMCIFWKGGEEGSNGRTNNKFYKGIECDGHRQINTIWPKNFYEVKVYEAKKETRRRRRKQEKKTASFGLKFRATVLDE